MPSVPDDGPNFGPNLGIFLYYIFSTCPRRKRGPEGGVNTWPGESTQKEGRKRTFSSGGSFAANVPLSTHTPPTHLTHPSLSWPRAHAGLHKPKPSAVNLHVGSTCFLFRMLYRNRVLISFLPTSFITVVGICLVEKTNRSAVKDKVSLRGLEWTAAVKARREELHSFDDNEVIELSCKGSLGI